MEEIKQEQIKTVKKEKMPQIELLRIVCCVLVIFNHTFNQFYTNVEGTVNWFPSLLNLVNVCAVGCFLIITGFFMFDGEFNYIKKLKKLFIEIVIPAIIVILGILLFLTLRNMKEISFFDSLWIQTKSLLKQIFAWGFVADYGYLWFILAYIVIVVLYPLWYLICKDERVSNIARRVLICACLISIFFNDILNLSKINFAINVFSLINVNMLFVLIGYELKLLHIKGKLNSHGGGLPLWISICTYVLSLGLLVACTMIRFALHGVAGVGWNNWFYHLNNLPVIMCAISMFIIFLNVKVTKGSKLIYSLSSATFYIYLVQSPLHVLRYTFIPIPIFNDFAYILVGIIVTVASFAVGKLFQILYNALIKLVRRKNEKKVQT